MSISSSSSSTSDPDISASNSASEAPQECAAAVSIRESTAPLTRSSAKLNHRTPQHTFDCNFAIRVGEEFQASSIPDSREVMLQQYYESRAQQVEGTRLWRGREAEGTAKQFLKDLKSLFHSNLQSNAFEPDVAKSLYLLDQFDCNASQALTAMFPACARARVAATNAKAKMNGQADSTSNYEPPKTRSQNASSPRKVKSTQVPTPQLPSEEEIPDEEGVSTTEDSSLSSKENTSQADFQRGWALVYQLTGFDIMKALGVNDEVCFCCKDGGDIICCDKPGCRRSFHLICHGLSEVPQGSTWFCKAHSCFECNKNLERDVCVKPCIICSKASCTKHRSKFSQRKGYVVKDICEHCASLTETDPDFFEWHLFSLHRILQHQDVSIDFKTKDGAKLVHLDLYKATLNLQDSELNNMNVWRIIANSLKVESAVQLQQHFIRVLLPYKKLYFDSGRYAKSLNKSKSRSGKLSRESSGSSLQKASSSKRKRSTVEIEDEPEPSPKRPGLRSNSKIKP